MGASKVDKGFAIFKFLAPTNTNATAFGQPSKCPFNDPTPSRITFFAWHWAFFDEGFATPPPMFDVSNVAFLLKKAMNIRKIVAFIRTKMLVFMLRAWHNNRNNQIIG